MGWFSKIEKKWIHEIEKRGENKKKMETNLKKINKRILALKNCSIMIHYNCTVFAIATCYCYCHYHICTYLLWHCLLAWLEVGARPPNQVWREEIGVEHVAQPQKVVKDGHCKEEPKEELVGFVVGTQPLTSPLSGDNTSQTLFNH